MVVGSILYVASLLIWVFLSAPSLRPGPGPPSTLLYPPFFQWALPFSWGIFVVAVGPEKVERL
jgi:hypothetical protein